MSWKHLSLPLFILALASCSPPPPSFQHHIPKNTETDDQGDGDATPDKDLDDKSDSKDQDTSKDQETMPDPMKDMETPKDMEVPKEDDKPVEPPFDPCPEAGKTCLIMPLGDSITWGINGYSNGGYRVPLFKKALAEKKNISFVGNEQTGPSTVDNQSFPKMNEGHPGWTIDDIGGRDGISKIVVASLQKHKPHIITLMIGTNDTDINADVANAPKRLGNLLDTIAKTSPDALIVVAQLVPSRKDAGEPRVQAYNAAIPALVQERAESGLHIISVDMHSAITANAQWKTEYYKDDLHPKEAGFDVMANVWWTAISKYLK